MNYKFIVNPITNRKVLVNGRLGKQIVNQYLKQGGGANPQNPLAFLRSRQNKKTVGKGSPRKKTARASNCTLYHKNPIKCNTIESCTYRTISGKGQCYKSSATDIEQARERARTGATVAMKKSGQEKAFDRAAGSMLMKGLKRRKSFGAVVDATQQAKEVKEDTKAQTCETDIATLKKEKIQLLEEHATQIASLEQRIEEIQGEKDEQIATLEQRIEEMQGEKDALIAAHTAEIARLQQETGSSFDQERESLQQANQQCQTQKEELTAVRDAAASEYETEKERLIVEHQAAIEELRGEKDALIAARTAEIARLQQETGSSFDQERESLQQANQQCQTQKEELTAARDTAVSEYEIEKERLIAEHQAAIEELRQEIEGGFTEERESLQRATQQCQTQKEELITAHEEAIAQLRQETGSSFDQERESLQQANQQCQTQKEVVETQKEAVETERDALKVERDQYKESISALEEQITGLAQQIIQLEQTMGDCEPRIEGLTSELTEAREAESTCKARIESILEEKDELVTAHRSEITRVSEENTLSQKDLKTQIRTLDNELKLVNRGLERTLLQEQRKLERAQAQITKLNRRKTALETQLAESEQQYIATTEILERERLEKARLVKELQDVKKRLGGGGNQPCRNPRSAACRAHRRSAAMFEPIDYARVSRSAGKKKCESYKHNETQCNADPGCNYINYNCISKIKASKALRKRVRRAPIPTPTRTHIPVPVLPTVETIGGPPPRRGELLQAPDTTRSARTRWPHIPVPVETTAQGPGCLNINNKFKGEGSNQKRKTACNNKSACVWERRGKKASGKRNKHKCHRRQ